MALPLTGEIPTRTPLLRRVMLGTAIAAIVAGTGLGGYIYYYNNSPHQLAVKAQLALDQHDPNRAVEFLTRALSKNPGGDTGVAVRDLMARSLIDAGRESDARIYLQEVLARNPNNAEALQLLAESHIHPAYRKFEQAFKPLSAEATADIFNTINGDLASLAGLPRSACNDAGQAELHHLDYLIVSEEVRQANAALNAAQIAQDDVAVAKARQQLAAIKEPVTLHEDKALLFLQSALLQDPANAHAASLLAQYEYEDRHYPQALAIYQQMKKQKNVSRELALTAANTLIVDTARQPDHNARFADAQKILEAYLADHPKDSRILVAIGQVMLEQNLTADANNMADRASAETPGDLDAQILLINCRLREHKTADAMNLINPLTNAHSNVPQVWYLLGLADSDTGDLHAAESAFRKAVALNPSFLPARHALLSNEIQSGNMEAAVLLASQVLRDDRYYMPAWSVTVARLRKLGQADRARALLTNLADDPELPAEDKPELVGLLVDCGVPGVAEKLLASLPPNDEATLRLEAVVAGAAGDGSKARALMAQALAADPGNSDLRLQYAGMLMRADLRADARAQFDQVSQAKLTADESLQLARGYLALRLPDRAAAVTRQLLAGQPKNVEALALSQQARTMLGGNGAETGTTQPSALATVSPEEATVDDALRLARAALNQKNYTRALSLARSGLGKDNANARLHEIAARALAGLGQPDQAVDEIAAAANTQPDSPDSFAVFVDLFPTADDAARGLAYAGRLLSINPALGAWAMGRLAETSGQPDLAGRYYADGIKAVDRTTDPTTAKEVLYSAVFNLRAAQKDAAGVKKAADEFAKDAHFAVSVRLAATSSLLSLGDRAGAEQQLTLLTKSLQPADNSPRVVLAVAQSWLALGYPDRARAVIETQVDAGNKDPQLLSAYVTMLERSNPDKALLIVQQLVQQDPANPQYQVALGDAQAAVGDFASAFRTLDDARSLGQTGRQLATAARVRLLIAAGLLKEAADELATHPAPTTDDFASMLALGQAWAQVDKRDEARSMLQAIPAYAAEYPSAQVSLAGLHLDANQADQAVKILERLRSTAPGVAAGPLFRAYLRAGHPEAALELAKSQRALAGPNTASWRTATLYAAAAAREARQYDAAAELLESLDPASRREAGLDLALLQLLQNKQGDAATTAADLSDAGPAYSRTTLRLLAGGDLPDMDVLSHALPSTVYAALSAMNADQQKTAVSALANNPNILSGDVEAALKELANAPDARAKLRQLALAQKLIEAGWTTSALDVLDALDKSTGDRPLTLALVQRHEALSDLHRTEEANRVRDVLAARLQRDPNAPPGVRILLAAAAEKEERYNDAIALLQPLAALNRPDILTTLATLHEKLGQLDEAIALHRQVRRIDPSNILAANNLAYTLAAANPNDKAALAEARQAIQFAIDRAPQVTAFQDTLGWIEILSGKPADGTKRIARVIPSLRLDPAVHYHLGIGYARIGQTVLAKLHLRDVEFLAATNRTIPEVPLATMALKNLPTASAN